MEAGKTKHSVCSFEIENERGGLQLEWGGLKEV